MALPNWLQNIINQYRSGASRWFLLHGDVDDTFVLPSTEGTGSLTDYLVASCFREYDVVLTMDPAEGIGVRKGRDLIPEQYLQDFQGKPSKELIRTLHELFLFFINTSRLQNEPKPPVHLGLIIKNANYIFPCNNYGDDVTSPLLAKQWSQDPNFTNYPLATFILTPSLGEIHNILSQNINAQKQEVPFPDAEELSLFLSKAKEKYPAALKQLSDISEAAELLQGTTLQSLTKALKIQQFQQTPITKDGLEGIKRKLVEETCENLIEFIKPCKGGLDTLYGQDLLKARLRGDIKLWESGNRDLIPKGYLIIGPVGTGKTFFVETLAGESCIPVVKINNSFRGKYQGDTEGRLEKIFRLLHSLPRCFVFIDEADATMGKRNSGENPIDSRVYSMFAQEMSADRNRGRLVWILATSRPDQLEVDLKRPGRMDLKIPLLPCAKAEEGFILLSAMGKRFGMDLQSRKEELLPLMPKWLTPGAGDSLVRTLVGNKARGEITSLEEGLVAQLKDYQPAVRPEIMELQTKMAVQEASDARFIAQEFRYLL